MPLPGPFLFRERSAMNLNFYTLCVIYLVYSFLGWVGETVVATAKGRRFTNRGVASGPFCFVYGTAGVLITIGLNDQRTSLAALFFGSMIYATVVEWLTAKLLERIHHRRWWDYSDKRFNLEAMSACNTPCCGVCWAWRQSAGATTCCSGSVPTCRRCCSTLWYGAAWRWPSLTRSLPWWWSAGMRTATQGSSS